MAISAVTKKYIAHTLELIRVSNGLSAEATNELRVLERQLRILLSSTTFAGAGYRPVAAVIAQVDKLVSQTYSKIAARQLAATNKLIDMEATWATRAAQYVKPASASALAAARANFHVLGVPVKDVWATQASQLIQRISAEIRLGATAKQSGYDIAQRVLGVGERGGAMEGARRNLRASVDSTTNAAAFAGRREAMRANGVNALKWLAILDARVCVDCAERIDKMWDMDGNPLGHDIPFEPPPLHPWCRCILLPMKYPKGPPEDGGPGVLRFDRWLESISKEEQDDLLGVGRAELWRQDKITTSDLIGQNGRVMTLGELEARMPKG